MSSTKHRQSFPSVPRQRGVATLLVALSLLIILTIIILSSSNVALFEQKTTTNENREMLANQAAEYALNVGGEFLKANVANISANVDDDGWLTAGGTNLHWRTCSGISDSTGTHPCYAAPASIRSQLYYYTTDGTTVTDPTSVKLDLYPNANAILPTGSNTPVLTSVGGTSAFPVTVKVHALLCRLDTSAGATPSCQTTPTTGTRIAVTLIATSSMSAESAGAVQKETWATYNSFSAASAMPLVASGIVKGLGNASIVAAPNAGGYGLPGSIWSPNEVDVSGAHGGIGSVTTCHLGDYLGSVPVADLETTCAGNGNTGCGCSNVPSGSPDMLSGHFGGSYVQEGLDVLDVDGGSPGEGVLPDIQFFPGYHTHGSGGSTTDPASGCMDDSTDATDDNLFEWIFGQDVNGASTCDTGLPSAAEVTREDTVLADLGGTAINDCSGLNSSSSGLYYVTGSSCSFGSDVGSPDSPVVVVTKGAATVTGNFNLYGMLFVRSTSTAAGDFTGHGNVNIFGSVISQGDVNINGGLNIIYVDTSTGTPGGHLSATTRFAVMPGTWLDSRSAF